MTSYSQVIASLLDEIKASSAWDDALNGEDESLLEAVNEAEALLGLPPSRVAAAPDSIDQ